MNIGQKTLAFALGAFFVVGVAAVATSAAGAPDADEVETEGIESVDIEIVEVDSDDIFEVGEEATFDVASAEIEAEETDARVDSYDGDADYYHVPVGAVDDGYDGEEYDHSFNPAEASRDAEFAGADGYVVEAEKVDADDPRVVAHVAENDPRVDGITRAEDLQKVELEETEVDEDGNTFTFEVGEGESVDTGDE